MAESKCRRSFEVTVYAESNFVLELALLQEQHESCERSVTLAESGHIELVPPAYSLVEPFETTTRSFKKRQAVSEDVRNELRQLGRSAPYGEQAEALSELTALLIRRQEEERSRLQGVISRLLQIAEFIHLTPEILTDSLGHQEAGFSPQDAVVYASILKHLADAGEGGKVFLNRNSKDFDDPDVQDSLEAQGCKLLFSFDAGADYVQHDISRPDS